MNKFPSTPSPGGRRILVAGAMLCALAIASFFLVNSRSDRPDLETRKNVSQQDAGGAATGDRRAERPDSDGKGTLAQSSRPPGTVEKSAATIRSSGTAKSAGPLIRTAEGRIALSGLADFQAIPFPGGEPAYEGEKVTAYIAVPSTGRKVALTVNQLGEFPRIETNPSEQVEVLLAFSDTKPGDPIAVVAQDGGKLHTGKLSAALQVDDARQLAFAFTVSPNPGLHRVSFTTPAGELKSLEFWAGPPPVLMSVGKR